MSKTIKIEYKNIEYAFLCIPFLKPSAFVNYSLLDTVFDYWRIVSMFFALGMFAINTIANKKRIISRPQTILWIYAGYMLLITILNRSSVNQWVLICLAPVSLVYWLERWRRHNEQAAVFFLLITSMILIIANTVILVIKGNGGLYTDQYGSTIYLLGMRTRWTDVFLPFFGIIPFFNDFEGIKKKSNTLLKGLIVVTIVSTILQIANQWIFTAVIGLFLFVLVLIVNRALKRKIEIKKIFWASLAFNILVTFFRIQNIFGWLLTNVFHKDVGFNSRTMIWDIAIEIIIKHWVLGYGITSNTSFVPLYGGTLIAQGHSIILQLLHDGGIIGLIIFIVALLFVCEEVDKRNDSSYIAGLIICISLFLGVSEIYFYHIYIFSLFGLCTTVFYKRKKVIE